MGQHRLVKQALLNYAAELSNIITGTWYRLRHAGCIFCARCIRRTKRFYLKVSTLTFRVGIGLCVCRNAHRQRYTHHTMPQGNQS